MGIIYNNNAEEKELYSAYGLTVYGKENRYDSVYSPDVKSAYISLRISNGEENLIDLYVGNRCIFNTVFNYTIDNFLYWISKDKPNEYDIEKAVFNSLCQSNSLFNHKMNMRKKREQKEVEYEKRRDEIREEERKQIDLVKEYCEKENLLFKQCYEKVYLIKLLNEKARGLIENADNKQFEGLRDFMNEHPDNTDAVIVMYGDLEDIARQIG